MERVSLALVALTVEFFKVEGVVIEVLTDRVE